MKGKISLSIIITLLLVVFIFPVNLFAQSGRLAGIVQEAGTGQALIGANVMIVGTTIGTATDNQGQFLIGKVPPGTYEVTVRYIGYADVTKEVTVQANRTATSEFELTTSVIETDEVVVTGERLLQSQTAAINAQYEASNIKNVVSSDLMGSFPDEEAVEAIARIPGVIVDGDEAIMRGLPADWALVTVNGEKIPAVNAAEDRHSSLQTFPIDLIQAIEVSKGQTADMDADAIGGNINFILKDAPSSRLFSAKFYRGWSEDRTSEYPINQLGMWGPTKASLTIGDVFADGKLGWIIAGTYEYETASEYNERNAWNFSDKYWERYQQSTDRHGKSTTPGVRYLRKAPTETKEMRAGFNTSLVWRPSLGNKLTFKTFYSAYNLTDYDLEITDRYTYYRPEKDKTYDGYVSKVNDVKHEPKHVMNVALGGEHMVMGDLNIDYTVQYTNGRGAEQHDFQGTFRSYYEDRADGDKNFYFDNNNFETETFKEDEIVTALNLRKPFYSDKISGYVKAGFKYKNKDRYNQKLDSDISSFDRDLTDDEIEDLADDGIPYPKKWTITEDQDFIIEYDPPINMAFWSETSTDIDENYEASEEIISAYAMSEVWLGRNIMVLPGIRMEKTTTTTESRLVDTFRKNNPEVKEAQSSLDATGEYTDLFPSLNLRFKLPQDINLRLSGSKGIARPSFRYFVEFNDYDIEDKELFTGNKDLKPTRATNFDIILEHYSPSMASHISAGFFYKKIDDVIDAVFFVPASGEFHGYEVDQVEQPQNVGTGTAQGIELSLQRQLDFINLPQVGLLVNWTHQLDTYLEDKNKVKKPLPSQADDVFNLAVSYELPKIGFSGRISYQYVTDIYRGEDDGAEEWLDARNSLDISLRQNLNDNVRLFIKGKNLLSEDSIRRYKSLRPDNYGFMGIYNTSFRGPEIYGGFEFSL